MPAAMFFTQNSHLRQYSAVIAATFGFFISGLILSWPAIVIPKFMSSHPPNGLHPNSEELSWIIAIVYIGNMISPIPTGYLIDQFGRKYSLLYLSIIPILSWILILLARTLEVLYIARFLSGVWTGVTFTIIPIYLCEIVKPKYRGLSGTLSSSFIFCGSLTTYTIGPYISYSSLAATGIAAATIFFLTIYWFPESPYFYLMRKNKRAARESLLWLNGGYDVEKFENELNAIENSVKYQMENKGNLKCIFTIRGNRKAFIIVEVLSTSQRTCGASIILIFATSALPDNAFFGLRPQTCVVIISVSCTCVLLLTSFLTKRVQNKILLTVSSIGCGISMTIAAVWYYLRDNDYNNLNCYYYIPFLSFWLHGVMYSIGLGPVINTIKGELFPANIKGLSSAITTIVLALGSFLASKSYLEINDIIGTYANYMFAAISCFLTSVFTVCYVIETKNKTLQDIQIELNT